MDWSAVLAVRDVPKEVSSDGTQDTSRITRRAGVGLNRLEKAALRHTLAMTRGNR